MSEVPYLLLLWQMNKEEKSEKSRKTSPNTVLENELGWSFWITWRSDARNFLVNESFDAFVGPSFSDH